MIKDLSRYLTPTILLWLILIGAFVVRLHDFNGPIADWHSWRQADTSAVSRNFVKNGFDLLHPRFEDISNVPSGLDNPNGYRFVEFPIYNVFQAGLYKLLPIFTIEEWGRLVSIFSSELTILFLFLIVKRYTKTSVALTTAFIFAFLPYNIYYGRTILPDPTMNMAILGTIYYFDRALGGEKIKDVREKGKFGLNYYICLTTSLLFAITALLLKPFAAFFFLPMFYIAWRTYGLGMFKQWRLYLFTIIALIPLLLWRLWMTQYPEGIPASAWLFNGGGIRFRPAFFRWMLYERVTKLFLGFTGLLPLVYGTYINWKKRNLFYFTFLLSSILYVVVVARGNVQHDYYQIPIMPTIAMFVGLGSVYFLELKFLTKLIRTVILGIIFISAFYFSWGNIGHFFDIDNPAIVEAGQAVNKTVPPNAKVIAPYGGDTSFLYQTNRQGWPSFEKPLPELIKMGANYLVIVNPPASDRTGYPKLYKLVLSTPKYILLNLNQKP